ncbi:MAG: hypothetical protein OXI05_04475 [Bacteroidota bacterium]|nr:hypothetical protein [Bacteroidota bacterium]
MTTEGYVLHTYGKEAYLRHAIASVTTLRRYDSVRPIALYCTDSHIDLLRRKGLTGLFTRVSKLPDKRCSINGFKHHLHEFKPWERSLYVDSDMIWCRNPDPLWTQLSVYPFTATGLERADFYFGGPKNAGVILEFFRDRRRRTLTHFGLTHLPRVQAGMMYAADPEVTRSVCELASDFHSRASETHFRTRLLEGRTEESCEWSLAMAMSRMELPVYHWYQGANSPQLDYIVGMTEHTEKFDRVTCDYYTDRFIYEIRGIKNPRIRQFCIRLATTVLRKRDRMKVTPFVLHFGWFHAKQPFYDFADCIWEELTGSATL